MVTNILCKLILHKWRYVPESHRIAAGFFATPVRRIPLRQCLRCGVVHVRDFERDEPI